MGKLQEVVRTLRHAGAVVNGSCGMHVHVDASRHTPQSLKNALSIMYSKEDILFKALNVNEARVERWCQKVREPMLEKIRKLPTNISMERLKREWYGGNDGSYEHYNWTIVRFLQISFCKITSSFGIYLPLIRSQQALSAKSVRRSDPDFNSVIVSKFSHSSSSSCSFFVSRRFKAGRH